MVPRIIVELLQARNYHAPNNLIKFLPEMIGLVFLIFWIMLIHSFRGRLTLTPVAMTMERRRIGIFPRERTIETQYLSNPRYESTTLSWNFADAGKIRINTGAKTRWFAYGIREDEAYALIGLMMEVYKFPTDPVAIEDAGLASN